MLKSKTSRLTVAFVAAGVLVLVAGGVSIASNMAFKLNRQVISAGTGQRGSNWTSIPYINPYPTANSFCTQTGLSSTGTLRATITVLDETLGSFTQASCGTPGANTLPWIAGKGFNVRQPTTGNPGSIIIVGSHNPSHTFTIPDAGTGQRGSYWFAVPYHTTAVSAGDLCSHFGMTSTGTLRGTVQRLDPTAGSFTQVSCGTPAATGLNLILGESVNLREPNGPLTARAPRHF